MTKPMNTWKERFLESFGHDHPWNGECASVNMGNDCDCRTKGMLMFIKAELQRQREEIVEEIRAVQYQSDHDPKQFFNGNHMDGYDQAIDDIIKKVEEV